MNYKKIALLFLFAAILGCQQALAQFSIADQDGAISIVYDIESSALDSIAAHLLARDIEAVSGQRPEVYTTLKEVKGNVIILGNISSDLISSHIDTTRLSGRGRPTGGYLKPPLPLASTRRCLSPEAIRGDPRGMAYGVFDLSKQIGVSPWYWWADVQVEKQNPLLISSQDTFSSSPSVKYRGVFLNDEGWGLEPWASKTFEPSVGNMGPKTYAKIFELLLQFVRIQIGF